mgnify:CR=1 FL=1
MIREGQIVLFSLPRTDQAAGKLRPALVLRRLPGAQGDSPICMVSSQLHQQVAGLDETVSDSDSDFRQTGLKRPSLIRVTRIAVVCAAMLHGAIGQLSQQRLDSIRQRLANWLLGALPAGQTGDKAGGLEC